MCRTREDHVVIHACYGFKGPPVEVLSFLSTDVVTLALARDQGKGVARVRAKRKPGSHIKTPGSARKCEGVDPHTPKATPMLGVGESWSPKRTPETSERVLRGQNSMAWCALYIDGKLSKCRCLKWARIAHLDI
ncbi:unnamed protein product [Sphagnum jensenii]|uniref:Uncharacterized protein n=1 Tax=Sphagnum jensenii TaxID=128206 RepID=A0ABP1BUQ7_9BRYO